MLFATKFFANLQGITSLNIFTIALLVITFGELCLSPIGLSIMTKLSTEKLQGMMMGMWFLASAYGQYVAGIIGANMAAAKEGATNYEKLITYTEGYKDLGTSYRDWETDRKSTRLNSSHRSLSRMPSSA